MREVRGRTFDAGPSSMSECRIDHDPLSPCEPLQRVLDGIASAILVSNASGKFVFANSAVTRLTGFDERDLVGRDYARLFPADSHSVLTATLAEVAATQQRGATRDLTLFCKRGERRVVALTLAPLGGPGNGMVWTLEDITERERTEEALRESQSSLARAQAIGHFGSWDWDMRANTLRWSPEIYRIFGLNPRQRVETYDAFLARVHPDDRPLVEARVKAALCKERGYSLDHRIVLNDGRERIVHEEGEVAFDADGQPMRMIGTVQDITELKSAEQRLRQSEELFATAFRASPDLLVIARLADGRITNANQSFLSATGCSYPDIIGKTSAELGWVEDAQGEVFWRELRTRGRVRDVEVRAHSRSGEAHELSVSAECIDINHQPHALLVGHEITQRKRAEAKVRFQADLLNMVEQAVVAINTDGEVLYWNRAAERLYGWPADTVLGRSIHDLKPSPAMKIVDAFPRLLRGEAWSGEVLASRRDGGTFRAGISASPMRDGAGRIIGAIGVCSDITERKKWEEELIKTQKLESIGLLAGGIAHDFNNVLTAILGNVALAKLHATKGDPIYEALTEAERGFWRAQDLTRQLLTFSKGGAPMRKVASLAQVLDETPRFALAGSNVRVECDIPGDLWLANFDPGQISQVLNNLAVNARQAMPDGGTARIVARNTSLREHEIGSLPGGNYVEIGFIDQGVGIDRANLLRVFDPYFTTKSGGTGLGLATSYSIIKRHGGHIAVESEKGRGATFHIYLPAADQPASAGSVREARVVPGRGRVLLMDDEESIRQVGSALLQRLGYRVDAAVDGAEALRLYRAALTSDPYAAVILDLTVPDGMGGRECLERLKAIDPNVNGIVSSGYSNDPVMSDFPRFGFVGRVAKPYQLSELSEAMVKVVGNGRRAEEAPG